MQTIGQKVRAHFTNLLPVFNLQAHRSAILALYDLLTRESMSFSLDGPVPKFSIINHDGIPFEFSVSSHRRGSSLRILTEVGLPGSSIPARINLSCTRLTEVLDLLNLKPAADGVNAAFAAFFPKDPLELVGWQGGIWVAGGFNELGNVGLQIYLNAIDGPLRDRWMRVGAVLGALGRMEALQRFCQLTPILSANSTPLGAAIELFPDGIGRVKAYLVVTDGGESFIDTVLSELDLGQYRPLLGKIAVIMQKETHQYPPASVVISLEFPRPPLETIDVKVDFSASRLFSSDEDSRAACLTLAQAVSINMRQYECVLEELSGGHVPTSRVDYHSFIGIGLSHQKGVRTNIYLKPLVTRDSTGFQAAAQSKEKPDQRRTASWSSTKKDNIGHSIGRAVSFLVKNQSPPGQWIDFALPTGPADAWVTAYTGLALTSLPESLQTVETGEAVSRASRWCMDVLKPDYGWGYNGFTPSDADSTAYTILFLTTCQQPVPKECYARLLSFQNRDGGFATYQRENPSDAWGISHPDVTPVVLRALLTHRKKTDPAVRSARRYILSAQNQKGTWESYWWETFLYSTWANILLFAETGWRFRRHQCASTLANLPLQQDAFNLALLGSCLVKLKRNTENFSAILRGIVTQVLQSQNPDGGWQSRPMLRLTKSIYSDPWAYPEAGDLYRDQCRLFTTSTVLNFLTSFYKAAFNKLG